MGTTTNVVALSLRASLLALLLAGLLLPLSGLAWMEYETVSHERELRRDAQFGADALEVALRAEALASEGGDPLAVAVPAGTRALMLEDGAGVRDPQGAITTWPELRSQVGDKVGGTTTLADPATGVRVDVAWGRVPEANAALVLVRPSASPALGLAAPFVILALFLVGGAALLFTYVGARVLAPVRALERASEGLAREEGRARVPVEGPTEVRALARAFNDMAETLDAQRARLATLVDERTRALIDREGDLDALRFTLAHEFREPLRSLRWMADDLLERPLRHDDREAVLVLRRRIDDVDAVFRDLLRYEEVSRRPAPIAPVEPGELLRRAHTEAERTAPLRLHAEPMPTIEANGDLLRIAFEEILRNAAQHGRRGGATARVRVEVERDGEALVIRFDDDGTGIPAGRRDDALHLFQRLRRETPGTGVGLALARRAIERNGGTLALDEAPGGGTRVVVRLPVAGPEPSTPLPREPPRRRF